MPKSEKTQQSELIKLTKENCRLSLIALGEAEKRYELIRKHCELVNEQLKSIKEPEPPKKPSALKKEYDWVFKHIMHGWDMSDHLKLKYSDTIPSMIIPESPGEWRRRLLGFMNQYN